MTKDEYLELSKKMWDLLKVADVYEIENWYGPEFLGECCADRKYLEDNVDEFYKNALILGLVGLEPAMELDEEEE